MRSLAGICMGRTFLSSNFRSMKKSPMISVPVGSYWMSKSVESLSEVLTNYKLISTLASIDDSEILERNLNVIVSAMENAPNSSEEICIAHFLELCNAGNFSIVARLLQSLQGKSIFPGPNAYNVVMEAAGKAKKVEIVSRVFKDLVMSCGSLPWSSFYSLANGFDSTKDNTLLLRLVKEIVELTFPRNLIVINRIIFAFGKCRQSDKALMIFYHIKDSNCKPDLVTYNTVLDILGRAGRVDEMLNEFASMKKLGTIPDFISYNTLLNNLQEAGRLDLCLLYLREMCESGIKPDLLTYTALIQSFGNSGNIEEQLRLFDDMKRNRIRPSIYIYRSLINSSKKMGQDELAKTLVKDMKASLPYLAGPRDFKRKGR